jgi:hypothetical protein
MLDNNDNLMLIDFDRSKVIEKETIKKRGPYINLNFMQLINCFRDYGRIPGKEIVQNYIKLFKPTGTGSAVDKFRGVGFSHTQNAGISKNIPIPMKDIDSVDIEWSK